MKGAGNVKNQFFATSVFNCITDADEVLPKRFIWVLGDNLLDDAAPKLDEMEGDNENKLYIHENYAVKTFPEGHGKYAGNNPYIKICGNLTEAIRKFPLWLPFYIVILLSNSYAHDDAFVEYELRGMIYELLSRVVEIIAARKGQLPKRAISWREPIISVMRLLPKPGYALRNIEKFKHTHRKANSIIEEVTTKLKLKFINADEITCSQKALFNKHGHLEDFGFERMWVSISDAIQRLDKQEIEALKNMDKKVRTLETQTPNVIDTYKTEQKQPHQNQYHKNNYQVNSYAQYPSNQYADKYHYYNY